MNESDLVKQAAVELGVDKPIMSYKVVGDRIELHLLGGSTAVWTARPVPKAVTGPVPDLAGPFDRRRTRLAHLSTKELRSRASERRLRGRSKMSRSQLIEALEATSD
ncbi:MAG: hypothetical protein WA996_08700 [Candidatus Promineifilaceae bacterium]